MIKSDIMEDAQVVGKVLTALGDLKFTVDILMPIIWEKGPHRMYMWQIITCEDMPFNAVAFRQNLQRLNRNGRFKPQVYSVEEYPADEPNYRRTYLTVCV